MSSDVVQVVYSEDESEDEGNSLHASFMLPLGADVYAEFKKRTDSEARKTTNSFSKHVKQIASTKNAPHQDTPSSNPTRAPEIKLVAKRVPKPTKGKAASRILFKCFSSARNAMDRRWTSIAKQKNGPRCFLKRDALRVCASGSASRMVRTHADYCETHEMVDTANSMRVADSIVNWTPTITKGAHACIAAATSDFCKKLVWRAMLVANSNQNTSVRKTPRRIDEDAVEHAVQSIEAENSLPRSYSCRD